jgi:hypothetical protein
MHSEIHTFHLKQLMACDLDFASCSLYSKSNLNESAMTPYARTKVPAEHHVCMHARTIQNYQRVALIACIAPSSKRYRQLAPYLCIFARFWTSAS